MSYYNQPPPQGYPPQGYAPPPGQGYPPPPQQQQFGQPAPPPGGQYGQPQYAAPPHGQYGAPPPPPGQYGAPPPPGQYGAPPPGQYGAPPPGQYPQPPYGAPPPAQYGAPPQAQYGQPPPQYGAPPPHQAHVAPVPAPFGAPDPPSDGYGSQHHGQALRTTCDANAVADLFRKAMKGFGTSEKKLIEATASLRSPDDATAVRHAFQQRHNRRLLDDIYDETSGDFRDACLAVVRGPKEHDAWCLNDALEGPGTSEDMLDDVCLGRSNADLDAIEQSFRQMFAKTLISEIKGDLSANTENMYELVFAKRRAGQQSPVMPADCQAAARQLREAFETDHNTVVVDMFITRSGPQLAMISSEYSRLDTRGLAKVIKDKFSGHMEDALLHLLYMAENPAKEDADRLEDAMKGVGTKDTLLIARVMRLHWNPQRMHAAKEQYRRLYGRSLADKIKSETSGDYEDLLVRLVGAG